MTNTTPRRWSPDAVLLASAFVLVALIIVQAGRLGWPSEARAEMVSQVGGFTMLTTDAGNDDMLVVLDNRTDQLTVYKVENQSSIEQHKKYELSRIFADARSRAQGRK